MKNLLLLMLFASAARADQVIPSTGPDGGTGKVFRANTGIFFAVQPWDSSINGTGFNGQDVSLTILFNEFFIRAFTQTETLRSHFPFQIDANLPILASQFPSISGTATLLNASGQPINSSTLNVAFDAADVQLFFYPDFSVTPVDIYGVQFNLQFGNSGGEFTTSNRLDNMSVWGMFGVGPGIPKNIVPDTGPTLALFLIALSLLYASRHKRIQSV